MIRLALAAAVQAAATPAPAPTPAPVTVNVVLTTSLGRIVIALEKARAPITTANFLRYVDGHRLDGITFYRTVKVQPDFGFVQFGVQNAARRVLPPIRHEPTTLTGVHHTDGAISIARTAPGTAAGGLHDQHRRPAPVARRRPVQTRRQSRLRGVRACGGGDGCGEAHPRRAGRGGRVLQGRADRSAGGNRDGAAGGCGGLVPPPRDLSATLRSSPHRGSRDAGQPDRPQPGPAFAKVKSIGAVRRDRAFDTAWPPPFPSRPRASGSPNAFWRPDPPWPGTTAAPLPRAPRCSASRWSNSPPTASRSTFPTIPAAPMPRPSKTVALTVASPSKRRLQPIAPSADWRVDLAEGCPAHCSYCYLAGSLKGPPITRVYANLPEILDELPRHLGEGRVTSRSRARQHEGTTYEASCYTDPLALEHLTGSLSALIAFMGAWAADAQLRFTSKFARVDPLLALPHHGRTRMRASINPTRFARFEGGTAPVAAAAGRAPPNGSGRLPRRAHRRADHRGGGLARGIRAAHRRRGGGAERRRRARPDGGAHHPPLHAGIESGTRQLVPRL